MPTATPLTAAMSGLRKRVKLVQSSKNLFLYTSATIHDAVTESVQNKSVVEKCENLTLLVFHLLDISAS